MKKTFLLWATGTLALAAPLSTSAQTSNSSSASPGIFNGPKDFKTWSIGENGGLLGPVAPTGGQNDFSKWKASAGYGAYVKWQLLHALGIRADYIGGKLKADNTKELGNDEKPVRQIHAHRSVAGQGARVQDVERARIGRKAGLSKVATTFCGVARTVGSSGAGRLAYCAPQ